MPRKSTKAGRKALPDDQKTSVFGIAVLRTLHGFYKSLPHANQAEVRELVRKAFESEVKRLTGGLMIAHDDRG